MDGTSEYWYSKKPMPQEEREEIKGYVRGEYINWINIGNSTIELLRVDGVTFRNVFLHNRKYLYRGDFTAPPNENDYLDATNYLTEDGLAGFSITETGWLVSLFSNYEIPGFARAVKDIIVSNAYKLVCIVSDLNRDNGLLNLYESVYGFREYARTVNDSEIMREYYGNEFVDRFVEKNGYPFHIFMIGNNSIGETDEVKSFNDYFQAEEYVEKTVVVR